MKNAESSFFKKIIYVIITVYVLVTVISLFTVKSKVFLICYSLGTFGAILYTYSLYRDIINMYNKKKRTTKGFYIRYLFSASLFLLGASLFEKKTLAVISVFLGLINVKLAAYIAGFLFGGDRREKKS
ncbi:ATPase [Thermosipho atlanticus]|uniref:ATP synthase I chain n=1 Tax=Thermosipho atlanticus DSM 15807 TaxID=1123380 RepID=A0A1M5RTU4_9BACT|nr:ATPase [Thermosipho atlanticus]SHH29263.1 hypothetical protein SAMN02745199_0598 [Thermosipho atlanticus DSM 15807]